MDIEIKKYDELTKEELYALLRLRSAVFVVEQNCVYQDIDGKDNKALHVLGKTNGELAAYSRLFRSGDYFKNAAIGRVVVSPNHRKQGLAKRLMEASMDYFLKTAKVSKIELSAQAYLQVFYNDLGFIKVGEPYLEDGIPHIKMVYG